MIQVCSHFGVEAITNEDTGVWVEDGKICAIGWSMEALNVMCTYKSDIFRVYS